VGFPSGIVISRESMQAVGTIISIKDEIIESYPSIRNDDITKAIIAALRRKKKVNISQLTEEERKIRRKASRRINSERKEKTDYWKLV